MYHLYIPYGTSNASSNKLLFNFLRCLRHVSKHNANCWPLPSLFASKSTANGNPSPITANFICTLSKYQNKIPFYHNYINYPQSPVLHP